MLRTVLSLRSASHLGTRRFTRSGLRYNQNTLTYDNKNAVRTLVATLEKSPIVQAVTKRMQQRAELQSQMPEDMGSPEYKALLQKLASTESLSEAWEEWRNTRQLLDSTLALYEDPEMRPLAAEEGTQLLAKLHEMKGTTFPALLVPPSETASMSAMIEVKPGVGGEEAMLFAQDVMRMYTRLAANMGWKATVVANDEAERGGIKEGMLEIKGENTYDLLKWESGVHRVQRVPATESSGRVHTSTIAVLVLPLQEDNGASDPTSPLYTADEVRVEVMRSRGAGGQHVNKTESAVRLTHIPTGITVSMQDQRSQHQNRHRAFQVLQARLMDRKMSQEVLERRSVRRSLVRSADRSEKIRTYNYAQDRVTDHRLGMSLMGLTSVMEGDSLRVFIDELARKYEADLLAEVCEVP